MCTYIYTMDVVLCSSLASSVVYGKNGVDFVNRDVLPCSMLLNLK